MITRQQLEIINRKTLKYPLHVAEKDYFLAVVLRIIAGSRLGNTIVFKGGTALHHCYLEQYRFSEDLDFSAGQHPISLDDIHSIFSGVNYLNIKKDYLSGATVKIERLQYTGPLVQPNSLKVEIDFLQNVLLTPRIMQYNNVWGIDFEVKVMDIREICAEKIRAASDRARYRDFYDLFLILDKYRLDLSEITDYIRQKEIRQPITKANIKDNWKLVSAQNEAEVGQIYYSKKIENNQIEQIINSMPFEEIIN